MKYIIFGGFDYAVMYEMDQNAILQGVDYFVDTDEELIGTDYLGKPIRDLKVLLEEDYDNIMVLIGSVVYKTELEIQLKEMGLEEKLNYMWAVAFNGDGNCPRLWRHTEWSDKEKNANNLRENEEGEFAYARYRVAAKMVEWENYDTIIDVGAASERLRSFVPEKKEYIPIDYVRYTEHTMLFDLNKHEFPCNVFNGRKVYFAIEVIQYCSDWTWFLDCITKDADCLVLGHTDFARVSREYRKTHWTRYNALFDHQIIQYLQGKGYILTDSMDFRLKTTLYKFERKEAGL